MITDTRVGACALLGPRRRKGEAMGVPFGEMVTRITVKTGMWVDHKEDGTTTLVIAMANGRTVTDTLSSDDRHSLLNALTWKPGDAR